MVGPQDWGEGGPAEEGQCVPQQGRAGAGLLSGGSGEMVEIEKDMLRREFCQGLLWLPPPCAILVFHNNLVTEVVMGKLQLARKTQGQVHFTELVEGNSS